MRNYCSGPQGGYLFFSVRPTQYGGGFKIIRPPQIKKIVLRKGNSSQGRLYDMKWIKDIKKDLGLHAVVSIAIAFVIWFIVTMKIFYEIL